METFISILRGINVGGNRIVPIKELKSLYEDIGFKNVITYIQSGNVIFEANKVSNLSGKIEKKIKEKFQLEVPVIIRSVDEMRAAIAANPFIEQNGIDISKLHITFLSDTPNKPDLENIKKYDYSPDKFIIINNEVYLFCPNGYGSSKLSNSFFENKLKVKATTRNWKTVNKLVELSGK